MKSNNEIPERNLELGMPSLDIARRDLVRIINEDKKHGNRLIKVIHGYGSSGAGGILRSGLRHSLQLRKREGVIRAFITGEEFGMRLLNDPIVREFPQLVSDKDFDKGNAGITIVVIF